MNNKMFTRFFTIIVGFALVSSAYATTTITLVQSSITSPNAGQTLNIAVYVTGGENIASYATLLVFDRTALKYIDARQRRYLKENGVWIRPAFDKKDGYVLKLNIGGTEQTGKSITTPLLGPGVLSVDDYFFEIPDTDLSSAPFVVTPGAQYQAVSMLSSAPLDTQGFPKASSGDGALVTLTFEVLEPKRSVIALTDMNLSDPKDKMVERVYANPALTIHRAGDVNGDDVVNILDLVYVSQQLGRRVIETNRAADVTGDNKIDILDLVRVARYFGT
ncbi:MAG: dockerin type I domain-containing protein [Candidatus Poribacteria bacterium]|nr:dockerin type I domain-containing protein [Candidatus Poribacteria bacterium]